MKCTNCGNEVPDTANVCGYCGQRLKSSVPEAPSEAEARQVRQTSQGIPAWIWGLGGVVLIGGIVLVAGIVMMNSSGLFAPTSNNQSNQPIEPVAPIQIVITATQPLPPQPTPTTGPQWVEVFREDFSDPPAWDTNEHLEIQEGRIVSDGSIGIMHVGEAYGDFRLTYEYQWLKFVGNTDYCHYMSGVVVVSDNSATAPSNPFEFDFVTYLMTGDEYFFVGSLDSPTPTDKLNLKTVNKIQIEVFNSDITVTINGQTYSADFSFDAGGSYNHIYLTSDGNSKEATANVGCKDVRIAFDNVLLEEYYRP